MVRFKNRHLLVEFIDVSALSPFPPPASVGAPTPRPRKGGGGEDGEDGEEEEDEEDEDADGLDLDGPEDEVAPLASVPFMAAQPNSAPLFGEEGTGAIYKAVRGTVQAVFGDEGWGRVGSSFRVIYHSPLTSLTIMRVARPHYRLLWGALTLTTAVDGVNVLPRVVAVSGTIKKLQSAAIVHHRHTTAAAVATLLAQGAKGEAEKERLQAKYELEREALARMED